MEKKRGLLFLLAILILPVVYSSNLYDIEYKCPNNNCWKGSDASWVINITNSGSDVITITRIKLVEKKQERTFAEYLYEGPDPAIYISSGGGIKITPLKKAIVELNGTIPSYLTENNLVYYPCFTFSVKTDDWQYKLYDITSVEHCYNSTPEVMPAISCLDNDDCAKDEYCVDRLCKKLNCTECQYIKDHKCFTYRCCLSFQCSSNQYCFDHECINLDCSPTQTIYNHSCVDINCSRDERIINKKCVKLDCGPDEGFVNHECVPLNCSYDEYFFNHSCAKLECLPDETPVMHSCVKLDCLDNETAINHSCISLECYFFQDIKEHSCINNANRIITLSIELLAIITIVTFLILDFLKIEHSRGKQ